MSRGVIRNEPLVNSGAVNPWRLRVDLGQVVNELIERTLGLVTAKCRNYPRAENKNDKENSGALSVGERQEAISLIDPGDGRDPQ